MIRQANSDVVVGLIHANGLTAFSPGGSDNRRGAAPPRGRVDGTPLGNAVKHSENEKLGFFRLTRPKGDAVPHMISAGPVPVGITTVWLPHGSIRLATARRRACPGRKRRLARLEVMPPIGTSPTESFMQICVVRRARMRGIPGLTSPMGRVKQSKSHYRRCPTG
jgi:hypothetical protein